MEFNLYLIRNVLEGGSLYVGKTTGTIQTRWAKHKSDARRGSSTHMARAIRKYGPEAFVIDPSRSHRRRFQR